MRTHFALMVFVCLFLPPAAHAGERQLDKISTINHMVAAQLQQQREKCNRNESHACAFTMYHYEVDERGRLYFTRLTAYGEKNSSILRPGFSSSTLICQLNAELLCDMPEADYGALDPGAYAIGEEGVKVHGLINAWENMDKAALFLAQVRSDAEAAERRQMRIPVRQDIMQSQSRMMEDLACFMFDFDALVEEYKINGRLVEDRSIRKLDANACLTSFEKICADPGSRADEVKLASDARAGAQKRRSAITAADIGRFCRSLRKIVAADVR